METVHVQSVEHAVAGASVPLSNSDCVAGFLGLLRDRLAELKSRFHVRTFGLFGSYIRGEANDTSDLDVLVEFDRAPTFFRYVELKDELSELLGVKVDLVMKSALRPEIGRRILDEVVSV